MSTSRLFQIATVLITLLLAGCSSTHLTGSWKNTQYSGKVKNVYIVGIASQEMIRRIFEDELSRQLQANGAVGTVSYRDLPTSKETDKAVLEAKAGAAGADALMITRAVGKRTEQVVNPGRVRSYELLPRFGRYGYSPDPYYSTYGSYYARSYDIVYEPATVSNYEVVTLEANLYNLADEQLIWSAQLETVVDGAMDKLIADFVSTVTRNLKEQGLL